MCRKVTSTALLANGVEDHFLLSQVEGAVIDEGFGVV
jgi:hypothetical protein